MKPTIEQYNEAIKVILKKLNDEDGITEEFWNDPVRVIRELWREQKNRPISFKMALAVILSETMVDCGETLNLQDEWVLDFWIDTAKVNDERKYKCVCQKIPQTCKAMKRKKWDIESFLDGRMPNIFCRPV